MAVMLTIEGSYKKSSNVAGKKDLGQFTIQKPWPIAIEQEDFAEMQSANFYIKNFMLDTWLRDDKEISKDYLGHHGCSVEHVRELDDEEIEEFVKSGKLLAIDPHEFTAEDVSNMKRTEMILAFVMMDGDQTPHMAQTKSVWQGRDVKEMRSNLKTHLGLEDAVEKVTAANKKRTSKLLKSAGKEESEPKRTRAPRKAKETVEVSE